MGCYEFWPAAVQTFERLGEKFVKPVRKLCDLTETANKEVVTRSVTTSSYTLPSFRYTLHYISVQLQVDNHVLEQAVAGFFARAVGRPFEMRLAQPCVEG